MSSLIIAITMPNSIKGESQMIQPLLEAGVDYVHVRKLGWESRDVEQWLNEVPSECHSKLTIHYHHHLVAKYELGGVHQSRGYELSIENNKLRTSRSCHQINEMVENCHDYDYLFISPVFDSISKEGYKSGIDHFELLRVLKHPGCKTDKAVALGGISVKTIQQAKDLGFKSIALLGGLWALDDSGAVDKLRTEDNLKEIIRLWKA